jgi:3-hydroxyisobutyrate dehydrogenase
MLAGEEAALAEVRPLLSPMCAQSVVCGAVPQALLMKLAVNHFMIVMVAALAEAAHVAERSGLDVALLMSVLDAGPMASDVSRVKGTKLATRDFSVQAAISNVRESTRLITSGARAAGIASPLIDVCHALFAEARSIGLDGADIAGVLGAFEERSTLL